MLYRFNYSYREACCHHADSIGCSADALLQLYWNIDGRISRGNLKDERREQKQKESGLCLAGMFKKTKTRLLYVYCSVSGHVAKQMALTDRMVKRGSAGHAPCCPGLS